MAREQIHRTHGLSQVQVRSRLVRCATEARNTDGEGDMPSGVA